MVYLLQEDNNDFRGTRVFLKGLARELQLSRRIFLQRYNKELVLRERTDGYEQYIFAKYSLQKKPINIPERQTDRKLLFYDKQIQIFGANSNVEAQVEVKLRFKSEIRAKIIHEYLYTTKIHGGIGVFKVPFLYALSPSILGIVQWVADRAQQCLDKPVSLGYFLRMTHTGGYTLLGTEAGKDGPVSMGIKSEVDGNQYQMISLNAVTYNHTSGHYEIAVTYKLNMRYMTSMGLSYFPTIYNSLIPKHFPRPKPPVITDTTKIQSNYSDIEKLLNEAKLRPMVNEENVDYFFMVHPDDFLYQIDNIDNYDIVASILVTKDMEPDGTFIPSILDLTDLGDYTFYPDFLNNIHTLIDSGCVYVGVYINGKFQTDIKATVDAEFHVVLDTEPRCDSTINIVIAVRNSTLLDEPMCFDGCIMSYKDLICARIVKINNDLYPSRPWVYTVMYAHIIAHRNEYKSEDGNYSPQANGPFHSLIE